MSDIELKTWAGQEITPQLDAIIYDQLTATGISRGCGITYTGSNTIHIDAGYGIIRGRQFVMNDNTQKVTMPESGTLKGRIYLLLDLANADTPLAIKVQTASGTLPDLPTDPTINYDNGSEAMELCTFTVGVEEITDLTVTWKYTTNLITESDKIMCGIENEQITFNSDGTIDDVKKNISDHTVFNSDGSITEIFTDSNSNVTVVDTTFNTDGSITKKIIGVDMNKTTFRGIQNILNAHLEKTILAIGDEISITLTSSEVITMQILAIDQDSTHQVIFGSKYCLQTKHNMNSTNTNVGGWNSSAMRTYLNQSFYATLPDDVTAYIAERTVQYSSGNGGSSLVAATDKIWLPREKEVFGAVRYSTSTEGATCSQFPIYATSANRIKTMGVSGAVSVWWESSPSIISSAPTAYFCRVFTDGSAFAGNASNALGVVPCFQLIATA